MSKPIGYYTSYIPNDGGLLDRMEKLWGSEFEKLNNVERAYLIFQTAVLIWFDVKRFKDGVLIDVDRIAKEITQLDLDNKLGLVQALVDQIKSSNSLQGNDSVENLDSEKLDNFTI